MTKTALVTGGTSGIGLATVKKFLNEGFAVTALSFNDGGHTTELQALGDNTFKEGDVTDAKRVAEIIAQLVDQYGQLDVVANVAGIKAGADSVLVSHITMTAVDPNAPASLSKPVHQLLRRDLHFKGVIITDDLAMDAIKEYDKQTNQNVAVLAVEAGNDMLLTNDYRTDIPAIKQAVANGTISVHQLNQSVTRILRLKAKSGLIK
ncbi:SDR family NAD(P)-dependent oxidoreductase [Limosilactobacillus fermentum]|uniref:SDR family NAD(P)-dependent oxidoreductase n=1 Tax=Limosilactobacillus fermentum TaxID=1613 RepID=UPI0005DAC40F|nr:SDR family NAD(P)-dependent oxidoreductase [Limosilactobacillus fermentum]CDN26261.1 K01207 beta-N-acetylhexosaminidase [Limosilactobacillus fermentum]